MQPEKQNSGFEEIQYQEQIEQFSPEKTTGIKTKIEMIASDKTKNAQETVYQAINSLNSIKGFQTYVGSLATEKYNSVFDGIVETLTHLAEDIHEKSNQKRIELETKLEEQRKKLEEIRKKKEEEKQLFEEEQQRLEEELKRLEEEQKCLEEEQIRLEEEEKKKKEEEERIRIEKEKQEEEERQRKAKEFNLDNLMNGNYFSVLDQIKSQEKKQKEAKWDAEIEEHKNPFLQNILSSAANQGFGSTKYVESEEND